MLAGCAVVAAAAALGGCATVAPPPAAPSTTALAALAARLPVVAAGFRKGEARPTAGRGAAEGVEVAYSAAGDRSTAAATVELLADDTPAQAALDAALAEVRRAGPARDMREAGRFAVAARGGSAAAGQPLSCAETAGRYGRERVAGLVCAGRAGGALALIRVAMPARRPPPADPRAFAEAIAAGLADPAGTAGAAPTAPSAAPPG
jgi:hypothetical protein